MFVLNGHSLHNYYKNNQLLGSTGSKSSYKRAGKLCTFTIRMLSIAQQLLYVHLPQEARNEDVCFKWTQSAQLLSVNGRLLSDAPNMSNDTDLGGEFNLAL
jgi:hypothetical protein